MPTRLIVTDVDGCVAPETSAAFPAEPMGGLLRALRDANAGLSNVAPVTFCTGRPQPYVELLLKLTDGRHPALCENGALLYSLEGNTTEWGPGVDGEGVRAIRALVSWLDGGALAAFPEVVRQVGKEAQVSLYSSEPDRLPAVREAIARWTRESGVPGFDLSLSHYYLNVSLAGVNKGRSMRMLLDRLGLEPAEVVAIGDTDSDLAMREAAGWFACPANATDAVKAAADYVSPLSESAGVLDILARPECFRLG